MFTNTTSSSLDVIVPCYRYGHFLRQCVESVLIQSYSNLRILIIDDASPDNTADVAHSLAQADSRVTFRRHSENKGHIATYNEGIEWAAGDYLLLLSADDYLLPGALSRAVRLFEAHPTVGLVIGKALALFEGSQLPQVTQDVHSKQQADWRIMSGLEFIKFSGCRNRVPTPTAVVRTKLQKQLGGYRPDLPHAGDMEMWLRFSAHASVGILGEYQAVYRYHSGNMSLSYMTDSWLPDLKQRKAALDSFFETCSYTLPNASRLRRKLLWLLGLDAVAFASATFNQGKVEASGQISEFALVICPQVKTSLRWMKLACKQYVGFRAWCALRPAKTAASSGDTWHHSR